MRYLEFGKDKIQVSEIIMGLMRIGEMSTKQVADLIYTGLEVGINFLDTADIYAKGKAEEILGDVFKENPDLREKFSFSQNAVFALTKTLPTLTFPAIISLRRLTQS